MSITRLNPMSKKLRSVSTLSSSLCSSHRALFSSSSSSSFSLSLKESSRLAKPSSSPNPPALLSQCVRGMFSGAGRSFDERESEALIKFHLQAFQMPLSLIDSLRKKRGSTGLSSVPSPASLGSGICEVDLVPHSRFKLL